MTLGACIRKEAAYYVYQATCLHHASWYFCLLSCDVRSCRPVDFVAEAIAGISSAQRRGISMCHMVNCHYDDDVSLDSFLGWIQDAGYALNTIPDYTQW